MYTPDHFAVTDEAEVKALLAATRLGLLVTTGPGGLFATALPFVYDPGRHVLAGHIAAANPHRERDGGGEALVIFQGIEAYVSPSLYPSKFVHGKAVPTWNYEMIQVYGALTWRDDRDAKLGNVTALTDRFEAERAEPWAVSDAPEVYVEALLRGIVGVDLAISRVEAKRKMSQNRSAADREGVTLGLSGSQRATDRELAAAMKSLE